MSYRVFYVSDAQKTTAGSGGWVSVLAAVAPVLLELERISSLKEEERMTLKLLLTERNILALLLINFSKSLFYQLSQGLLI